jgi:hypothetical protein
MTSNYHGNHSLGGFRQKMADALRETLSPDTSTHNDADRFGHDALAFEWHRWTFADELEAALAHWCVARGVAEPSPIDVHLMLLANVVVRATTGGGAPLYLGVGLRGEADPPRRGPTSS